MVRFIRFSILILLLNSCNQEEYTISNLNENKIIVMGHGGMGTGITYPTNSFASISKSLELGANGSEFDVQLTKDSVLVAYHDEDLSDNTNLKGKINTLNWSEIKGANYSNIPFLNYPLISLDELFSRIENIQSYQFTFDCKLYSENPTKIQFYRTYTNAISTIISKYDLIKSVNIESQDEEFLRLLKNKNSNYRLFIYPPSFEVGLETAIKMGLFGITISTDAINEEQVKIAHDNNLRIAIWGVNSLKKNREAIRKNPDFIQTDRLAYLLSLLK